MPNRRIGSPAAAIALIVGLLVGGIPPAAIAQAPQLAPPPAGMARIWLLRQFQPAGSLATPMIYLNGAPLAASEPGTIFYHDAVPGRYNVSVDSCGTDVNQATVVELAPGNQAELEVQSLSTMAPPDCYDKETFYVRPVQPRFLQLYLPQLRNIGAR